MKEPEDSPVSVAIGKNDSKKSILVLMNSREDQMYENAQEQTKAA